MAHHQPATRTRRGSGGIEPEAVRVWLLGGFRVSVGSRTIEGSKWRLRKAASLVKLLALAPHHRMHRERVMELLWPDLDAKSAANNLHRTLHATRRAFETRARAANSPYLRLREDVLALNPDGQLWADVEVFEEAAASARRTRDPAAYRAASDLYAGELLPEDRYEEWVESRRENLRQSYLSLLVEMAALHEQRGDYALATEALERVVVDDTAHEDARVGLMRLHAMSGRRNEALRQYERLKENLSRKLGTEPGPGSRSLYKEILAGRFPNRVPRDERPAVDTDGIRRHNLRAPLTSFAGREQEKIGLKRTLAMTRLLTLTGTGGSGKTRLALEAARGLVGAYPDGAWLVELASLSKPEMVPRTVAAALTLPEQAGRLPEDTLVEYLETKDLLLILDNCEHLVDAVAQLAYALLGECPGLKILATSREPLEVPGEAVWRVPPLSVPDSDATPTLEDLMHFEAVRLFVDRARLRLPTFELTEANSGSTARVCRKLDGIPLAIELACARMGSLAVEQVVQRLDDSLGLLTGGARMVDPRQQTMRATLVWSYELLSGPEKKLFARLSVFAGGWTLRAAEDVCHDGVAERENVLDLLGRLADKSLVFVEGRAGEEARYRMLEPVRQYGWERLQENRERERIRERHARYYLALAEEAEPELIGPEQVAWQQRLATEYPNLRAALSWCLDEGDEEPGERAEVGLRTAAALGRFWSNLGSSEGREWLEKGLAKSGAEPASLRAKAIGEAGFIAFFHLDPSAIAMLEEALALFRELGDETGQAFSINCLIPALGLLGNFGRVLALRKEAEALLEESLEDPRATALLNMTLGEMAMLEQDHEQAVARTEKALALFKETGDLWSSARCLTPMGIAALGRGDVEYAARVHGESLRVLRQLNNKIATAVVLIGTAGVAVLQDNPARAAHLFGAAQGVRKSIGHPDPVLKPLNYDYEAYIASTRAELGDEAFEAAFSEGLAMSAEQAVEYALSSDEPAPSRTVPTQTAQGVSPEGLTERELEVALLAGRELSNRQIASELSISEHTVAAHIRKILKKLGLRSRAQIPSS